MNASYIEPNSQSQWYNSIDFSYGHQCSQEENGNDKIHSMHYLGGSLCFEKTFIALFLHI